MRPDAIGPRHISPPHHTEGMPEQDWSKTDDLSLVPDSLTLPKEGVNKSSKTETTATVLALLSAIKRL